MILDTMGSGPLGTAVRQAIHDAGEPTRSVSSDDPSDVFMAALGCRAVVCAAAPNLLEGKLDPRPSPQRMRTIVRGASAPGVGLVVLVVPAGERYADEERVLRKDGIPYVILRCAPLVEELAEATNFHVTRSLWLARGTSTEICTAAELARTVVKALGEDSWQGATLDVPCERVDLAEAVRRAARAAGAGTAVRMTSPHVSAVYETVSGWFGRRPPPARELYDRMAAAPG
jgi:hypothetical protein